MILIITVAILGLLLAIYFSYKRNKDKKQLTIHLAYLAIIISLGSISRIMHSISPLYIAQYISLAIALLGFLYYLFTKRFIWWSLAAPFGVLALYVVLAVYSGNGKIDNELTEQNQSRKI